MLAVAGISAKFDRAMAEDFEDPRAMAMAMDGLVCKTKDPECGELK